MGSCIFIWARNIPAKDKADWSASALSLSLSLLLLAGGWTACQILAYTPSAGLSFRPHDRCTLPSLPNNSRACPAVRPATLARKQDSRLSTGGKELPSISLSPHRYPTALLALEPPDCVLPTLGGSSIRRASTPLVSLPRLALYCHGNLTFTILPISLRTRYLLAYQASHTTDLRPEVLLNFRLATSTLS